MTVTPFTLTTDTAAIDDLRARLRSARWPDARSGPGWGLGADVGYLRDLAAYWADGYDWSAHEAALNSLPHFRVSAGGHDLHVVHARAATSGFPLLLAHGWPDSFWRYSKVIELLADPGAHGGDPADAFDVVVPDMPGYGYSPAPAGAPLSTVDVAGLYADLMTTLGYETFGAAGGDIGSGVVRYLALDHPTRVSAVHRIDAGMPTFTGDHSELSAEEREFLRAADSWRDREGAYAALHRTKPQTAAVGLADSPVGLLAWIVEKLRAWSDCHGDVESSFTRDEILTNVTIYWLTNTIGSAMRMYSANSAIAVEQAARRVETPSGFALFPADLVTPPRAWLERTTDLVRLSEMPRGGHFAPFEEPELYVRELREFFRPYRGRRP